jgi:5-hydroxyisourate hydrolase-like protein (transthyretin family)
MQARGDNGRLGTGLCSRTAPISQAAEDLEHLKKISEKSDAQIFGQVKESLSFRKDEEQKPYNNLTLKIQNLENSQKSSETITDSEGRYQVNVAAGKYKIIPVLPDYAKVDANQSDDKEVLLIPGSCENVYFHIENKSEISGKLVSEDGKTIPEVSVELVDFETNEWVTDAKSDANGIFKIESVPKGKYLLAVNKNLAPYDASPYPTTFYPGKGTPRDAGIIEIDFGKSLNNIEFRLLPNLKYKNITGRVFWSNGKPAIGVKVKLEDLDIEDSFFHSEKNAVTDKLGRFVVKAFFGRKYKLKFEYDKQILIKGAKPKKIGNAMFAPAFFYDSEKETTPFINDDKFSAPKTVLKLKKTFGSVQMD